MNPVRKAIGRLLALGAALLGIYGVVACAIDNSVAGGSSGVDNPQVLVAFVNPAGEPVSTTGSIGVYLDGQSPALNPDAVVEVQLTATDTVKISASLLAAAGLGDTALTFNLYLRGNDSTGAFLQSLSYDPATKKFSRNDTLDVKRVNLTVTPLMRTESVLKGVIADSSGLNRIIIPGSPFQAVVVDSVFVFDGIPTGVYTVHVLQPDGKEIPLPEQMDTEAPKYHNVNPDTVPVVRPPPAPTPNFTVYAGADRTEYSGTESHLIGDVRGVDSRDKRVAVLWRQLPASHPEAIAIVERPSSLKTDVYFPRPGAYTFVLSVAFGTQQVQDTVVIGVQALPDNPTFIEPSLGDTLVLGQFFKIVWQSSRAEYLSLEASQDSGATWSSVSMPNSIPAKVGFNEYYWVPWYPLGPSANCMVRLMRGSQVAAVSPRFRLRY